jgi:hypothetical protein
MIWLTWRQFRSRAIVAGAALLAFATALAITGPHLASLYGNSGLGSCRTGCGALAGNFISEIKGSASEDIFYLGVAVLYAAPALIGIFWGAPLVTRELETGTFRLAWNQSVPRTRWMAAKLGLIGLAAITTTGLLSLMTSWWASPLYAAARQSGSNALSISRLSPLLFGAAGVVPAGYAAFGFALGVTAGVLIRRTLPAMAVTLAVFLAVQLLMPALIRPHLIPPVRGTQALSSITFNGVGDFHGGHLLLQVGSITGRAGDWITGSHAVNPAGQTVTLAPAVCQDASSFLQCLSGHGVRMSVSYQPASRYWALQWLETGIFLVFALCLGAVCYWRIRRRA